MIELEQQLQNALTTTFLANLAFLSEYDNRLYHRVDELSRMIEKGSYNEKYRLEFIMENGDFDIYDIRNDKYLYNKNPKKINDDLIKNVNFDNKNIIFNIEEVFYTNKIPKIDINNRFNYENLNEFNSLLFNKMQEVSEYLNNPHKNKIRDKKLKEIPKFIFLGTLLGRHIPHIAEKVDAEIYLVLERNLEIFRLSLFTVDYTILAKKGVVFSVMDNYIEEENKILLFINFNSFDNYIFKFCTTGINIDKYIDNILTLSLASKPSYYNYSRRLYSYINRTTKLLGGDHQILINKKINKNFSDLIKFPILYIAAGPSLDEHLEWIKKYQSKFFIVTIGAAYKKLLSNDIKIDMITTLDEQFEILNTSQFDDESIKKIKNNTIILASAITNEKILKKFNQRSLFIYEVYESFFKDSIGFNGFSVGEVTLDILLKMNMKEIYLIGLDLALNQETGESHSKNTSSGIINHDFNLKQNRDLFDLKRSTIKVKGNIEKEVFTTSVFFNSIKYLDKIIAESFQDSENLEIINLSTHGAYFNNTISKKINDVDVESFKDINIESLELIPLLEKSSLKILDDKSKVNIENDINYLKIFLENDFSEFNNTDFTCYKEFFNKVIELEKKCNASMVHWIIDNYLRILIPYLSYYFNDVKMKNEIKKVKKVRKILIRDIEQIVRDYIFCLERIIHTK